MSGGPWWRIGWRNLGRNRRRTLITMAGLAFGYLAVVLLVGWMEGLTAEMIESATSTLSGQLQVHDIDYRPERKIYDTIGGRAGADVDALVREVASDPLVEAAAPRVYAGGLVSSGEATVAGLIMGIDPQLEPRVSKILQAVVEGRPPAVATHDIVIGSEMARQLSVGIGAELILVVPAADGSLGNDLYTVSGIFRSGLAELDASYAMMSIGTLQSLVALDPIACTRSPPPCRPLAGARGGGPDRLAPSDRQAEDRGGTLDPSAPRDDGLRPARAGLERRSSSSSFSPSRSSASPTRCSWRRTSAVASSPSCSRSARPPFSIVRSVLAEALSLGAISLALGAASRSR